MLTWQALHCGLEGNGFWPGGSADPGGPAWHTATRKKGRIEKDDEYHDADNDDNRIWCRGMHFI
jgi:hypothetical protein